jgi:putative flippase GtrA
MSRRPTSLSATPIPFLARLREIVAFAGVGVLATITHLVVAIVLIEQAHLPVWLANIAAFCVALPVSFYGHASITFRNMGGAEAIARPAGPMARFIAVALLGFLAGQTSVVVFVSIMHWPHRAVLAGTMLSVAAGSYLINRSWTFSQSATTGAAASMLSVLAAASDHAGSAWLRTVAAGPLHHNRWIIGPLVALVVVSGVWARLSTLGSDALFVDELYSWSVTKMDAMRILVTPFDVHPPLFYLVLKAFTVFGESEFALRSASAIAGLATAGLVFQFARKHCGVAAAAIGSALVLLSYKHIIHSSTARNYALLLLLALATTWILVRLARRLTSSQTSLTAPQRIRDLAPLAAGYSLLALGALMTHSVASIYLVVLNAIALLGFSLERPQAAVPLALTFSAVNVAPYSIFAMWFFGAQSTSSDYGWLQAFSVIDALKVFVATFGPSNLPGAVMLAVAVLVLSGVVAAIARTPADYWVPVVALTLGLPLALYALTPLQTVYMERTILFVVPGAGLAVAALLGWIRSRMASLLLGIVLVTAYLYSAATYVTRGPDNMSYGMQPIENFRTAMKLVDAEVAEGAALLTCDTFSEPALRYYGKRQPYTQIATIGATNFGVRTGEWIDYFGLPAVKRQPDKWITPDATAPDRFQRLVYLDVTIFCLATDQALLATLQDRGFIVERVTNLQGIQIYVLNRR